MVICYTAIEYWYRQVLIGHLDQPQTHGNRTDWSQFFCHIHVFCTKFQGRCFSHLNITCTSPGDLVKEQVLFHALYAESRDTAFLTNSHRRLTLPSEGHTWSKNCILRKLVLPAELWEARSIFSLLVRSWLVTCLKGFGLEFLTLTVSEIWGL